MSFTSSGFIRGAIIALLVGVLAYGVLKSFGYVGQRIDEDDPAVLAKTALQALDAVKNRQPGDRRPASYDAVLAPLDKLLRQARDTLSSPDFNPVNDLEKIRVRANSVIDIASQANNQAKTETGPLAKDYRFNDQKAEACQYLATALWERLLASRTRTSSSLENPPYPARELDELRRVIEQGLSAYSENRTLWYLRGVMNRAEGLFAAAASDLERAVAIDAQFAEGWNVLGLVRISLKEFDKAEEALERAKALVLEEARRLDAKPGPEYTAILYNLATYHEGLAVFYNRENRITPTVESRRLLARHSEEARRYLEEFLALEPAGSPDAQTASTKLSGLPR